MIAIIDPASHTVLFQNDASIGTFGDISNRICHEQIAGCATPCSFCKMAAVLETDHPLAGEALLPNDQQALIQWAKVSTASGRIHVVETITDITAGKRQQMETELLVSQLSATNRDLIHANQQLRDQSVRDGLTGLYNHSHFQQSLVQLFAAASRSMRALSLLFIDLDNFKQINDLYGHTVGDHVLRKVSWLLDGRQTPGENIARASDVAARYGGDEFALILPDTSMEGALSAAERLRNRVTALPLLPELAVLQTPPFSLTCSIGVASFPVHALLPADLIVAADTAVYAAKKAGRNCVRMATPTALSTPPSTPLVRP